MKTRIDPTTSWLLALLCCVAFAISNPISAAEAEDKEEAAFKKELNALPWVKGPAERPLGDRANLKISSDFRFLGGDGAKKRLKMSGNDVDGREILGMVEHLKKEWWVVFEFDDIGYVKDDEKNKLDADKILESYKDGIAAQNERRGGPPTKVVGWHTPPAYNETTHNLEWALIFERAGHRYVNYKVKLLGRHGVVDGTWVGDLEDLDTAVPEFRKVLGDFGFRSGQSYAEFRQGDKIAQYGLGALVLGGAAVGAAKLGLFASLGLMLKKFYKLIVVAVLGVGAWVKNLFTGRRRQTLE